MTACHVRSALPHVLVLIQAGLVWWTAPNNTCLLGCRTCRYQFSLAYFTRMFSDCIASSSKSNDIATRLQLLSDYTTTFVFKSVSRQVVWLYFKTCSIGMGPRWQLKPSRLLHAYCSCNSQDVTRFDPTLTRHHHGL